MNIPETLVKGDSIAWKDSATNDNLGNSLTSDAWTLKYAIRGPASLDLTAVADGQGWKTSMSTTQSNTLTAGKYSWQAYVVESSNPTNRYTLGEGSLLITDDISSVTTPYDGRSQNQKDLEAVQAAMRAMIAGGAVQSYMIGGRSVQKMSFTDLRALESKLLFRVAREKNVPMNLKVRFK